MTAPTRTSAIRPARADDAYELWLWANDADTRKASHGRAEIPFDQHLAWLTRRLDDAGTLLLVAEEEGRRPMGTVRFESTDGWRTARISYVVAPDCRGMGRSRPLVAEGLARLDRIHPGTRVWAEVMAENVASLKAFRGLNWIEGAEPQPGVVTFWRAE
ncbi:MAG TPA: GNAT family N-acetyltransferase [Gemmatimonadales bacterium]|nr:GNAT family N-acetyltransferase [Gemmatimonadales bacterium]